MYYYYTIVPIFSPLFQYGTMDIVNHKTKHKMSLNFKGHGWTGKDLHKVEGFIYDDKYVGCYVW